MLIKREINRYSKKIQMIYTQALRSIIAFGFTFNLFLTSVYASSDIFTKAEVMLKDIYNKILGLSTIAAVTVIAIAIFFMNFSKSGKSIDESRAWIKRVSISWAILNGLGFIIAYIKPLLDGGQYTP